MRLATVMPINLKDTDVAMTTLICRIGVKFKRCRPMTQARLTRGITTTSLLFPLGLSIQLAILHRFYPPPVLMYVMDESYPFFAPVLVPSVPLLSGGERVGGLTGRYGCRSTTFTAATTTRGHRHHLHRRGVLVSIRNDENSADLTKSFQELSRLPVLVNSGYLLGSFSLLVRARSHFRIISKKISLLLCFLFFFLLEVWRLLFFSFLFRLFFD